VTTSSPLRKSIKRRKNHISDDMADSGMNCG